MNYGQMKGKLKRRFESCNQEHWHGAFCMENTTICCLGKYLEVRGMKDVLSAKNFIGSNIVSSVAEGSYYWFKGKSVMNFVAENLRKLQIVAIVEQNSFADFKELRNKKICWEISSDIRNHILN